MPAPPMPQLDHPATIGATLARAVERWGQRDFVVLPDDRLTFAGAEEASRQLARRLLAAGLGKGSRVGIFDTYSTEWVVAWLAVVRIGALAMPFASTYRPAELRTVIRIGDVDTILATPELLGRDVAEMFEEAVPGLAGAGPGPLRLVSMPYLRRIWLWGDHDRAWARSLRIGGGPGDTSEAVVPDDLFTAVEAEVVPADWAQVTYTSGSSAQPKGVIHSHGSIVRTTAAPRGLQAGFRQPLPDEPSEPSAAFSAFPLFWIGGTLMLGRALNTGLTMCCLPRFEPAAALDMIEREGCTAVAGWGSLVAAMRGDPSFAGRDLAHVPALAPDHPGPMPPGPGGLLGHRSMSELVGNWAGAERAVVDPDTGQFLPEGEEGELVVRGWGALQGYYKREREETFDVDGWLHTGDRVVIHDGRVFFVGRFYEMIKAAGANVSPLEVEATIEAWPEVKHCFVVGVPHEADGEAVAAVVALMPGAALTADEIRARARGELSTYKVPKVIVFAEDPDELPWLASGKPDKRAMRDRLLAGW